MVVNVRERSHGSHGSSINISKKVIVDASGQEVSARVLHWRQKLISIIDHR
jgi:hypothetical protein